MHIPVHAEFLGLILTDDVLFGPFKKVAGSEPGTMSTMGSVPARSPAPSLYVQYSCYSVGQYRYCRGRNC
jgi:hypothetical protein